MADKPEVVAVTASKDQPSLGEEESKDDVYYFAIGSMANHISWLGRNLTPLSSTPAQLFDHDLIFFSKAGIAAAIPQEGRSFHGVLHRVSASTMQKLDRIEGDGYNHTYGKVRVYPNKNNQAKNALLDFDKETIVENVTIYTLSEMARQNVTEHLPPTERYVEMIVQGCEYHGVEASHVEWLKAHPRQKRRPMPELRKAETCIRVKDDADFDTLPVMTEQEFLQGGDGQEGRPRWLRMNGKVLEIAPDAQGFAVMLFQMSAKDRALDLSTARMLYDPKYGLPESLEDLTREHAAICEDLFVSYSTEMKKTKDLKVVGRVEQTYKDDDKA